MRESTDKLIERLAHEAAPVKPLAPPLLRASVFLVAVSFVMAAFALWGGRVADTLTHLTSMPFTAELAGAALGGVGAIVAAVMLSIPGRSPRWFYLPLPGIVLWLIGGGWQCYYQIEDLGYVPTSLFASRDCFAFIVGAGIPTAGAAFLLLRRSLSVDVVRVTALASLGAALMASVLLQFVHAHGTNPVDFATHVVAVATLMLFAVAAGQIAQARR